MLATTAPISHRNTGRKVAIALGSVLVLASCAGANKTTTSTASTVKLESATTIQAAATTAKATATTAKAGTPTTATTTKAGAATPTTVAGSKPKPTIPPVLKTAAVAPATTLKQGVGPLATLKPVTTARSASTIPVPTVPAGKAPEKPADADCSGFSTWAEAKQFYDTYYPYYGDFSRLDGDGDGIPCESLPGSPK